MTPQDPLDSGDLRIKFHPSQSKNPPRIPAPPISRRPSHGSGGLAGPLICLFLLFLFKGLDGCGGGGGSYSAASSAAPHHSSSYYVANSYLASVPPPVLPGSYAAIIRRDQHRDVEAIVFTYAKIRIVTVDSLNQIPIGDQATAISYSGKSPLRKPLTYQTFPDNLPLSLGLKKFDNIIEDPNSVIGASSDWVGNSDRLGQDRTPYRPLPRPLTKNQDWYFGNSEASASDSEGSHILSHMPRPPPRIVHGDVVVDSGPIKGNDELRAYLIAKHGHLKEASIDILDGSPRGPPNKADFFSRPVITVYVVGKILHFSGPVQKGKSVLHASIIDLGPTKTEFDTFETDYKLQRAAVEMRTQDVDALDLGKYPRIELLKRPIGGYANDRPNERPAERPTERPTFEMP